MTLKKHSLAKNLFYSVALIISAFIFFPGVADAAIFTVDSVSDASDSIIDGVCDIDGGTFVVGDCSLRAAIEEANANAGLDTINFNISGAGPHTIVDAGTGDKTITDTVTIDGESQTGATCDPRDLRIEIDSVGPAVGKNHGLLLDTGSDNSIIRGLVVRDYITSGIRINADNITVECSHFGTNAAATLATSTPGDFGLDITSNADGTIIGGNTLAQRNIFSGNLLDGVFNDGTNTTITGNYFGTDITGTINLGNSNDGLEIATNSNNTNIGGINTGEENLFAGNGNSGIAIFGSNVNVRGNLIGVDINGTSSIPNVNGITIGSGSSNVNIGGSTNSETNIISGNAESGINIDTVSATIQGNIIGLDINGTTALGNGQQGIIIFNGSGSTIGGSTNNEANIISANTLHGIGIVALGGVANNNTIQGNFIGTDINGNNNVGLGNGQNGIWIVGSANNNIIGGTATGQGNTIVDNGNNGIEIIELSALPATPDNNSILGNSIFNNAALGIELDTDTDPPSTLTPDVNVGPNTNDAGDTDTGPNKLLNFPIITSTNFNAGNTTINFDLDTNTAGNYHIEFFRNTTGDASAHGEGEVFLGASSIAHSGTGNESFSYVFSGAATNIAATTTEDNSPTASATSEFGTFVAGNTVSFGDAPDTGTGTGNGNYNTLASDNGPSHVIGGTYLGACVDADSGILQDATATGDDNNIGFTTIGTCAVAGDDDDGVIFTSTVNQGNTATVDVTASGVGILNAWIDFNNDGDFIDAGEQIFTDEALTSGVNSLSIAIPSTAISGDTFSRWRVNSTGGLSSTSAASDGEIEDHALTIENTVRITNNTDGAEPSSAATYTVDLGTINPGPATVTITYSFSGGTAIGGASAGAGIDYDNTNTTLNIGTGSQTGTISIPVFDDNNTENTESIEITLLTTNLGIIANDGSHIATTNITDDDLVITRTSCCGGGRKNTSTKQTTPSSNALTTPTPKINNYVTRPSNLSSYLPCIYSENRNIYDDFSDAYEGDQWAQKAFDLLYKVNTVNGRHDHLLHINDAITRAEGIKILYPVAGCNRNDLEFSPPPYEDILPQSWQEFFVGLSHNDNIIQGYDDGKFRPDQFITRAEFIKIITLYKGFSFNEVMNYKSSNYFNDIGSEQDNWKAAFAHFARDKGWIQGYENGDFGFEDPINRGQAARIVTNVFDEEIEALRQSNTQIEINVE